MPEPKPPKDKSIVLPFRLVSDFDFGKPSIVQSKFVWNRKNSLFNRNRVYGFKANRRIVSDE